MAEIFAERREREKRQQQADGNASGNNSVDNGGKRRKAPLPRFFIRPPVVPTLCPSSHSAGLVGGGKVSDI